MHETCAHEILSCHIAHFMGVFLSPQRGRWGTMLHRRTCDCCKVCTLSGAHCRIPWGHVTPHKHEHIYRTMKQHTTFHARAERKLRRRQEEYKEMPKTGYVTSSKMSRISDRHHLHCPTSTDLSDSMPAASESKYVLMCTGACENLAQVTGEVQSCHKTLWYASLPHNRTRTIFAMAEPAECPLNLSH